MSRASLALASVAALALASGATAQGQRPGGPPGGFDMEAIMRQLPLEGAPLAVPGPYEADRYGATPGLMVFRPKDLSAFPSEDTLPIFAWGNGGCARDPDPQFTPFLEGIATHGYLVVTTAPIAADDRSRAGAEDLTRALDWAIAENAREGSPLQGKIDVDSVAVMGVSCGGMMTLNVAADPRIDTIGVYNSGAGMMPGPDGASVEETLSAIHTPTIYLDGGEVDLAHERSLANFEAINHVPIFYGARENGGHSATYTHPGGGEFANVTADWLDWRLKGDASKSATFIGEDCALCADPNWDARSKGFD